VHVAALLGPALREQLIVDQPVPAVLQEAARAIAARLHAPLGPLVTDGSTARWLLAEGHSIQLERGATGWFLSGL